MGADVQSQPSFSEVSERMWAEADLAHRSPAERPAVLDLAARLRRADAAQGRLQVALRAWVASSGASLPQVVTRLGTDAIHTRGPTRHLAIGQGVTLAIPVVGRAPLVLPCAVHRIEHNQALLWVDDPEMEAELRLQALIDKLAHDQGRGSRSLYQLMHAA